MTSIIPMICQQRGCVHYHSQIGPVDDPVYLCEAFPTGIPAAIVAGADLHTMPEPGDDGIVFETGADVQTATKHLPGQHDQRMHTPHTRRNQGTVQVPELMRDMIGVNELNIVFWTDNSKQAMDFAEEGGLDHQVLKHNGIYAVVKLPDPTLDYKLSDSKLVNFDNPKPGRVLKALQKTAMGDSLFVDQEAVMDNLQLQHDVTMLGALSEKAWTDLRDMNTDLYVGEGNVTQLDDMEKLAGQQPRGWPPGTTFEQVRGVCELGTPEVPTKVVVGSSGGGYGQTALHEAGHALDLGYAASRLSKWRNAYDRTISVHGKSINPYYTQPGEAGPQEMFASAFAIVQRAKQVGIWRARAEGSMVDTKYNDVIHETENVVAEMGW